MNRKTWLELGRISNLPTVWSNVAAGAALSGAPARPATLLVVSGACSLLYVAGMFLNDAFDAEIDRRERPERPIPSGRVTRAEVFGWGLVLLGLPLCGLAVFAALGLAASSTGMLLASGGTALAIVLYDAFHKGHAWSPLLMGACRAGVYLIAAWATAQRPDAAVYWGAGALALYVVGLTHTARFETGSFVARAWPSALVLGPALWLLARDPRALLTAPLALAFLTLYAGFSLYALRVALRGGPGSIPRAVVSLIAGISLVDAAFVASAGRYALGALALAAFVVTLRLQRWVRGT